jgi:hypothetical protein
LTKTISIHKQIVEYLQVEYPEFRLHPRDIFYNYHKEGLRLTHGGYCMLKEQQFEYERFQIDDGYAVTGKTYITLSQTMIWPYYITNKNIWLFSSEDAAMLKIVGKFSSWIECLG